MNDRQVGALAICIQAGIPILTMGEPGTAKTATINAICRSVARHRGKPFPCKTIIAAIHEPQDVGGFGVPTKDEQGRDVIKLLPVGGWLTELVDAGQGVINFDEITCVPAMMQAACLRVFGEKVFGEQKLPDEIVPVAAANPVEQAVGGQLIAPPLANRVIWLDWTVDVEKVIAGFLGGWQDPDIPFLPKDWKGNIPGQAALVASFFKRMPHHMQQLPKDEDKRSGPWPSVRSWYDLGVKSLAACESINTGWDMKLLLLAGAVGTGTAQEFVTWVKSLDLPDPEAILKDPKLFEVYKERPDKTFAVLNSVIGAAVRDLTLPRWEAAWKVLAKAAKNNAVDVAGAAAAALARAREGKNLPLIAELIEPFHPILNAQRKLRQSMSK
jgi:hypothetical protein